MDQKTIKKHIESMGARVKFRQLAAPTRTSWNTETPTVTIDVQSDKQGDYYEFALGENAPEFKLLQAVPKERHMLLYTTDGQRFLLGHDERNWFVAGIADRVSSVRAAKQSLLPKEIWEQVKHLSPDAFNNRKNSVFLRQGEWFFVPTQNEFPEFLILRDEILLRSAGSKPHVCQELYREGGELIYIVGDQQFTADEYEQRLKDDSSFGKGITKTRVGNPKVYVRGYVRHDDHATITLQGWHRVFINGEFTTSAVKFLD